MPFKDYLPSIWRRTGPLSRYEEENPFDVFQKEVNRLFDDFSRDFDLAPFRTTGEQRFFSPSIDVKEDSKMITVKAELPGMEEKDVEVLLTDNVLTLQGEKKEEKEDKGEGYYHMERKYGSFRRVIPVPTGIDTKKVKAMFKNGVLTVTIAKTEEEMAKGEKIPVSTE